jgi:hypothetical protein
MRSVLPCSALLVGLIAACSSSAPSPAAQPGEQANVSPAPINPGESEASKEAEKDPSTELIVGVDAESFARDGYQLTSFVIVVKVDGVVAASETLDAKAGAKPLPHETRIVAPKDKPDALVDIEVHAVMNEAIVVKRRATTRFVKGTTSLAYIFLEIRCNNFALLGGTGISGPTCDVPGETCIGAKCRSEELTTLPVYKNDWATNPPSACGAGTSSTLVVGQGQTTTTPLVDGDTVSVECGPQGGHHIWLGLQMKDLAQSGTVTVVSASQPGGGKTVPSTGYPYAWSLGAGGMCELSGVRFQLDIGVVRIADFLGKPLDVKIDAEDKAGRKATVVRHLNISPTRTGNFCQPL